MMKAFRKNGGFTLVELLVTILTGSLVTFAAVTILFLGVRVNRQSMDTAGRQTTTRILLSALEDMATEGTISKVVSGPDSWQVYGDGDEILFSYDSARQTIYTGGTTPLLENVYASFVTMEGKLLNFSVETEDGAYSSSVLCRMAVTAETNDSVGKDEIEDLIKPPEEGDGEQTPEERKLAFLRALASQYTISSDIGSIRNPGLILDANGKSTEEYFSQWYITYTGGRWNENGWNAATPWCACYISWGLHEVMGDKAPCYANVDSFMYFLKKNSAGHQWKNSAHYEGDYTPVKGDLIFFDWTINAVQNPEHVGAVIQVKDGYVYTIEGNSAGRIALRKYGISDPRIIGYGVLNWTAAQ